MAKTAAGKSVDPKDLRAKAVANLSKHIQAYETADIHGVGHSVKVPKGMEDWHFVRFNKQTAYHREVAALLLSQGYLDCAKAAPEVRCVGFEADGENRLYLCCPPEVSIWHRKEKQEKIRKRYKLMEKDFGSHLNNIGGDIEIEHRNR